MKETVLAILVLLLLVFVCWGSCVTLKHEAECAKAGYEINIEYAGETWCFGRAGSPDVVNLKELR